LSLAPPADGSHPALLCLIASDFTVGACRIDALPGVPALAGLASDTEALLAHDLDTALQAAALGFAGRPLIVLDLRSALPAFTALRLLRLPRGEAVLSALDAGWLGAAVAQADAAGLDRLCWRIGQAQPLPALAFNPAACRIPAHAVPALAAAWAGRPASAALPASLESTVYLRLCTPAHAAAALSPPPPVCAALSLQLVQALTEGTGEGYPGLDARPVLLHALHGWGGGSARFVADLIAGDRHHHHLLVQAESDPDRQLTGSALSLRTGPGGSALRRQPLAAPIASTALRSRECSEFLQAVCEDFGVSGVLVSSLIGLSLDLLRTGLPTAVVCHDYHPLWPILHADFGAASFDASDSALAEALADAGRDYPFGERRPEAWIALRQAYVQAMLSASAQLIAPTRAALANMLRLAPELATLPQRSIGHGLADWPQPQSPQPPPPADRKRLRVLVPGRINGGKGEQLLAALIPQLPEDVELVLLGCGAAGMRFFGADRVHLRLDYSHSEFPQRVAELAPDLALLPASVAETFSYTLSELWSLGLPVLATRVGAYAERIEQGRSGLLVEPDAEALARALGFLAAHRAPLAALRRAQLPRTSLARMAEAYSDALQLAPRSALARPTAALGAEVALEAARLDQAELEQQAQALRAALTAAQAEAARRAQWARDQEKLAQDRTAWAQQQQALLNQQSAHVHTLEQHIEMEQMRLTELQMRLSEQQVQVLQMLKQLGHALGHLEEPPVLGLADAESQQNLVALLQIRVDAMAAEYARLAEYAVALADQRDQFEDERNKILGSASWKLTRPLRGARRLLAAGLAKLSFRRQRTGSMVGRGLRSLKTRGVRGTLVRIRQEARPALPGTVLDLPASAPFEPFALPCPDAPRVSVIIPVYNHLGHSLTCLRSIAAHPSVIAAEIIVVDDCSADETAATLPQIDGLRYQRNPENLGFIGACNAGAASARGEYLVFLNNDTAVQAGWLDALIDTFAQQPNVGLVGAKLIYPDGRLQEAGGIVFSDASGWNYGRFSDPAAPEYSYLREVDYCSGAAIAVPADLFNEFGGFDSHYAPAYYEDTDLAMKVWERGLRVLYQPKSAVVHFEGISSGTDTSTGVKAYQVVNQQKFLARWGERLKAHPAPGTPIELARQHRDTRRVLIIDATTPAPDQDSGSLRMVNLMRVLRSEGCAVSFFADNRAFVDRYTRELQQLGVEVLWHPFLADVPGWFAERGKHFDLIVLSRHYIAVQYIELARLHAPQATLVFDTVDLHYLREQREAALAGREDLRKQAMVTRDKELDLIRRSDITLVVSPVEQELLAREAPGQRVDILSNVHEVYGRRREFHERSGLVFMGGYQHTPNVDAVLWFADEVFPLIRAQAPEIEFHVVGSRAPEAVQALGERDGIVFEGFVPAVDPFMDACRLAVAPLRYGAGVKGKVNMSMSFGQPVVATPIAIEGMHAEAGVDVLVAETPHDFAAAVLRAYFDEPLWLQLSERGLANVEQHFGFESARHAVQRLFER